MIFVFGIYLVNSGVYDGILSTVQEFVFKNNSTEILESRLEQMEVAKLKFADNNLLGSGFMVPMNQSGEINFGIYFDLMVEPGNLVWCLLGDTGIVGLILFTILFLQILLHGRKNRIYLLVAAFMINMGEMVFFSSNNMSILCYFILALYLFDDKDKYYDEIEYNSADL
jgi:hypothetical protein